MGLENTTRCILRAYELRFGLGVSDENESVELERDRFFADWSPWRGSSGELVPGMYGTRLAQFPERGRAKAPHPFGWPVSEETV